MQRFDDRRRSPAMYVVRRFYSLRRSRRCVLQRWNLSRNVPSVMEACKADGRSIHRQGKRIRRAKRRASSSESKSHGAFADGTSWSKVIPIPEREGYHVVAVQNPLTSLADDATATKRIIALEDGPVILVGHSWGGAVITQVGDEPVLCMWPPMHRTQASLQMMQVHRLE